MYLGDINKEELQFLSVGHFTHDIVGQNLILGGSAAYSSMSAKKLGLNAGVITAVGTDFLHYDKLKGISIYAIDSDNEKSQHPTTTFENTYVNGLRRQFIKGISAAIKPEHIPDRWRNSEIVYLCPVANEIDPLVVHEFGDSIIGISPQGWMRRWDDIGNVYAQKWCNAKEILPYIDIVIMSEEDIAQFSEVIDEYAELAKIMVLTRGERGSTLFIDNKVIDYKAFKVNSTDPTGAGDVFATAFLIKYRQTMDPYEASIFANCAASFIVEKKGTEGIPDMDQITSRLKSVCY